PARDHSLTAQMKSNKCLWGRRLRGRVEPAFVWNPDPAPLPIGRGDVLRLFFDAGAVALGERRGRVDDSLRGAGADLEADGAALARDQGVRDAGRAMDEVPLPQLFFLTVDQQRALAGDDQEVPLDVLMVVEGTELPRLENGQVDADLRERIVALEFAD